MYKIIFYEDINGKSEVFDYIKSLHECSDKNSKVNFAKIIAYLRVLSDRGTRAGDSFSKHISGDIWELRPLKNRLFYAYCDKDTFIILHYFIKKTRKTPVGEIEKAKRNLKDYREREG